MAEAALPLDVPFERIVVIGASAGGVEALTQVAENLPGDLDAAVFVVLHLPEGVASNLAEIVDRAGPLRAGWAEDGARIRRGTISIGPPGFHLVLDRAQARLLRGPKVNGFRPAVDVLFHSAARAHGANVTGIVLSGALRDGTFGLSAIKRRNGTAIVQADAVHEGMPTSAIENVRVDAVAPARGIPETLTMLFERGVKAVHEAEIPESDLEAGFDIEDFREAPGDPSPLRCPECGGALWELEDGELVGYACHVGHTYSTDSMLTEQASAVERALWTAAVMLEEKTVLATRLSERMRAGGNERSSERFEAQARETSAQADVIRRLLQQPEIVGEQDA